MSAGDRAWRPAFLTAVQDETLTAYAELLIPRTDSPGARDALVNRTIDRQLAAAAGDVQRRFLASVSWIDDESRSRFGATFLELPERKRMEVLERGARPGERDDAFPHFMHLKMWIARAYYDSAAGMRELGWTGTMFHHDCPGCCHGAHGPHA